MPRVIALVAFLAVANLSGAARIMAKLSEGSASASEVSHKEWAPSHDECWTSGKYMHCGSSEGGTPHAQITRRRQFFIRLSSEAELVAGDLILTQERIYAFRCDSPGLKEACPIEAHGHATFMDTATVSIDQIMEHAQQRSVCALISGCVTSKCNQRLQWQVCADSQDTIDAWKVELDDMYLLRNQIHERLAPIISRAVAEAKTVANEPPSRMPESFSPFLLHGGDVSDATADLAELDDIVSAFSSGVVPFRPGKNSRSGAAFFFCKDRRFIAKRIRKYELESIWRVSKNGDYHRRMRGGDGSTLNAIYLGFQSGGSPWIIMRCEQLPATVEELMPKNDGVTKFFMDVKPKPLTSDRLEIERLLFETAAVSNTMRLRELDGWSDVQARVWEDAAFLESHDLVDYSLLMHGAFFELEGNASSVTPIVDGMRAAVRDTGTCAFGCSNEDNVRSRTVVDVTDFLLPLGINPVRVQEASYICCCSDMGPGATLAWRSPCQMVKTRQGVNRFHDHRDQGECRELLDDDWHPYYSSLAVPVTNGRCILGLGDHAKSLPPHTPAERMPQNVGPEVAFGIQVSERTKCGIVCVSVLDYLLYMNAYNQIENRLLLPVYGDFKWSNYKQKVKSLTQCLASAPLPPVLERYQKNAERFDACDDFGEIPEHFKETYPTYDQELLGRMLLKAGTTPTIGAAQGDQGGLVGDARGGRFPGNCVVDPGPEGWEWEDQLSANHCNGTLVMLRLDARHPDKLVGLRVLSTDSLLTGWFSVQSAAGAMAGADDDDWVYFRDGFTIKTVPSHEGGPITVRLFNRDGPIDVHVLNGAAGKDVVLDRADTVELSFDPTASGPVAYLYQRAPIVKPGWFFGMPTVETFPDVTGEVQAIAASYLSSA